MFNLKQLKKLAVDRKAAAVPAPYFPDAGAPWPEPVAPAAPAKPKRVRKPKAKADPTLKEIKASTRLKAIPTVKGPKPKKR